MSKITIKLRIIFMIFLMSMLLLCIGIYGLRNLQKNNESLKTVYEDRVVALIQIDLVARQLISAQWGLALSMQDDRPADVKIGEIENNLKTVRDTWAEYKSTYLTEEEKKLALAFEEAYAKLSNEITLPAIAAIRAGDQAQLRSIMLRSKAAYKVFRPSLANLIDLQKNVAKQEYMAGQDNFTFALRTSILAIALGLASACGMGYWLLRSISQPLEQAISISTAIAQGDLTTQFKQASQDEIGQLLQELQAMNQGLRDIVSDVRGGAEQIVTASQEIAAGNIDLSARTEQQASSLEETASSLEELTSTVRQNAANARQAQAMAADAALKASDGGRDVHSAVERMTQIRDSSNEIIDIIAVIDGIAFQTNILALNAAVEAARAGEQGRGFAVVASEVRSLAQRSAAAAKEIKELITQSVDRINEGTEVVEAAGETIQGVVQAITEVRDMVGEISVASGEQSAGIEQINEAVTQMDNVTQQNAALVEQAAAAAQSLEDQAQQLMRSVAIFKINTMSPSSLTSTLRLK